MDSKLFFAISGNDRTTFDSLVQENQDILEQKTEKLSTPLHLAARFGRVELVREIVRLRPDMVVAVNGDLETPLHEACNQGNPEVAILLLEADPSMACMLNSKRQSAFFKACSKGHYQLVNLLLNKQRFLDLEYEWLSQSSLHVAAAAGHTNVVREILNVRPDFAWKTDEKGYSPLHFSCSRDHLEITKMLLTVGQDLALQYDDNGYTPLHLAAMNGKSEILKEFMSMVPTFHFLTREGETVFHLTVRFNQYDAFMCLLQVFNNTDLFNRPDQNGNTILHLAVFRRHHQLAEYITNETSVDINHQNNKGHTVLDILNRAQSTSEIQNLRRLVEKAGGKPGKKIKRKKRERERARGKTSIEHSFPTPETKEKNNHQPLTLESHKTDEDFRMSFKSEIQEHELPIGLKQVNLLPLLNGTKSSLPKSDGDKHQSQRDSKEMVMGLDKSRNNVQHEIYREALQNTRNTIILVAILIATVAFTAGTNPPGGVYQDGPLKGKSTVARTTAFKVFTISNSIALFTSLCLVIIVVSIIPFRRKPLMRLLVVAHKVMWVAVSFMVTAFVAATCIILPRDQGTEWVFEVILTISVGSMASVFSGLGVMLARHWLRKSKWRKEKERKMETVVNISEQGRKMETSMHMSEEGRKMETSVDISEEGRKIETAAAFKFEYYSDSNSDAYSAGSHGHGYHAY